MLAKLYRLLGAEQQPASHRERIVSAVGGLVSITLVLLVSQWFLAGNASALLVASMGASAVLLFALPHGPLSQPWPVLGGQVLSAMVGVTCAKFVPYEWLAAGLAVGGAIGVMYYLRCIHPPGGATALSAVMGGQAVHDLGYQFVMTPVLINVVIILSLAVLYNALFAWRRYPAAWQRSRLKKMNQPVANKTDQAYDAIAHADFVYALSQIDTFVDVSEYDLLRIYDLATTQAVNRTTQSFPIEVGGYYSNGLYGDAWSVRLVVEIEDKVDGDTLSYRVIAGSQRRRTGKTTRLEFARWAKHRVVRDEDNWKRVSDDLV